MNTILSPHGASEIMPGLWQGGIPYVAPPGQHGVRADVVVLCAQEIQPTREQLPGVTRIHVPLQDAAISNSDYGRAIVAAENAIGHLQRGETVLVTCHMGINRSGLVTGLILIMGYGLSGDAAVALIRRRRKLAHGLALGNHHFSAFLRQYGAYHPNQRRQPPPPAPPPFARHSFGATLGGWLDVAVCRPPPGRHAGEEGHQRADGGRGGGREVEGAGACEGRLAVRGGGTEGLGKPSPV